MINHNNYYDKVKTIDFYNLPEALKKGHEYVNKATENGASWEAYHGSDTVKKVIDMYFSKLNEFTANTHKAETKQHQKEHWQQSNKEVMKDAMIKQGIVNPDGSRKTKIKKDKPVYEGNLVERMPEEIRYISGS
jgi:hypothetical protein